MDILNPKALSQQARQALNRGRDPKKVIYAYALLTFGVSLMVTLINYYLDHQISGTGGLGNLGTRAILSTAQQVLPLLSSVVALCLEFGYLHAMMRISRGQYADHTDLKTGLQLFWPILRLNLIQGLLIFAVAMVAAQLGSVIFMMTPWSEPLLTFLTPLMEAGTVPTEEAILLQAADLIQPLLIVSGIVCIVCILPLLFQLRMANFCLVDNPKAGALAAIRASRKMMRRRFLPMLKIDLSLWPYYLGTAVMSVVLYLDLILPMLGISVPLDATVFSLIVYAVALVLQVLIQITLRNRVETTYLMAYNALREKPRDDGIVLGNIFDM